MSKIAYLGPKATYTHEASIKYFGEDHDFIPARKIRDIFTLITNNEVNFGVVPVENSTGGSITDTLDLFIQTDLKIYDQTILKIHHNLLSKTKPNNIKKIFSHPQSFIQCAQYLEKNYPQTEFFDMPSNAEGAHFARNTPNSAAIGSVLCGTEYQLKIIDSQINDYKDNETKFFIIAKEYQSQTKDRSLIIISILDKVGGLFDILKVFKKNKINMTRIESRPSKTKNWDYVFVIEYENSANIKRNQNLLSQLAKKCSIVDYLGSY
ncbi:MAG: prephenate dehydratase [Spirochaetes bacterium]|nr:prephenate dehydratase [Spirochaetota bacterium]